MTYRLKRLSSLLILLMLLTSKPVQAMEQVLFFALPFIGSLTYNSWNKETPEQYDARVKQYYNNFNTTQWVEVGRCMPVEIETVEHGTYHKTACKQSDGSWKLDD